jgi:hypothetical protein
MPTQDLQEFRFLAQWTVCQPCVVLCCGPHKTLTGSWSFLSPAHFTVKCPSKVIESYQGRSSVGRASAAPSIHRGPGGGAAGRRGGGAALQCGSPPRSERGAARLRAGKERGPLGHPRGWRPVVPPRLRAPIPTPIRLVTSPPSYLAPEVRGAGADRGREYGRAAWAWGLAGEAWGAREGAGRTRHCAWERWGRRGVARCRAAASSSSLKPPPGCHAGPAEPGEPVR